MEAKTIIGIDPGKSGAIAHYNYKSGVKVVKMPETTDDLSDYFLHLKETYEKPLIFLEKVNNWTSDTDQNAGKRFNIAKMMDGYVEMKTIIKLLKIPFVEVHPASWQSALHLRKKGEEKADRKKRYKAAAGKYYPEIKPTLWNADALCIVQFGRLKFNTDPNWIINKLPPAAVKELF